MIPCPSHRISYKMVTQLHKAVLFGTNFLVIKVVLIDKTKYFYCTWELYRCSSASVRPLGQYRTISKKERRDEPSLQIM